MTAVVTVASGYDLGYVWRNQGKDTERDQGKGGYYINAAQAGEPPGRWFGRGAEALGFAAGQEVEKEPYTAVYQQVDPRDGTQLGRKPGNYASGLLEKLMEAEPHATGERLMELKRIAAQQTRTSPPYTDVTVSLVKSVSIFHTSIKENERQARLAGDETAAAWWAAREAEVQEALQAANRAGMEHLQRWAVTRVGAGSAKVDGQETVRYEPAGLIITSWLQGTSRDGDPQDHVHNQIARMSLTDADGKWRAVDTMAVRAQLGAVRATFGAHLRSELTRRFGVEWVPRKEGDGWEIKGITRAQIDKYSTRTQTIDEETKKLAEAWEREHGHAPNRRQALYIKQEATLRSRDPKDKGAIDHDKLLEQAEAKWEALDGTRLAAVAGKVSNLRGPGGDSGAAREPGDPGPAPSADAQLRAMKSALARVQEHHTTWTRADLAREMADVLPPEASRMAPRDSVALLHDLTDRALAGEAQQVVCLDAPEWPPVPDALRRELDGRSIYTRPGTTRYSTNVQLSRERELLDTAGREGAPHLTREQSAELLGATPEALEEAGHVKAREATEQLPSGVTLAQAAAIHDAMTSDRTGHAIVGPAGTGKTRVAATAARMWRDAGVGDVILTAPSQAACNVLREATGGEFPVYNNAQLLGHTEDQRGALGPVRIGPRTLILADESSMSSLADLRDIAKLAADNESSFWPIGDDGQLTAPEGGGGLALITRNQEHAQLAEPVRFAADWEGEASLRLRAGDTAVLNEYDQHGRIRGSGTLDEVMDEARKQFLAGYLQGKDVLLMAQNNATARELSQRIRDDLQHLGLVERGAEASLREGAKASVGDLIVTRKNNHRLGVANGDAWRVEAVDGETITMRRLLDADRETGERRFADETVTYGAAKEAADLAYADNPDREEEQEEATRAADLGYSITGHTAQGRTVWQGNSLITGTEDRNWAYVALTRGAAGNYAWVVTEPAQIADPTPGTRAAPELARHERIERERAGLPPDPKAPPTERAREPIAVLSDVLERDGTEYSALEVQRRNLANADHLAKLHAIWHGETRDAVNGRYERLLRERLPDGYEPEKLSGHATWLYRTLRDAEAAGLDAGQVLDRAIGSQPLTGARDVAAVVDARIRAQTGTLVPQPPGEWVEGVPEFQDAERHEYLRQVAQAMDDRTARLGEFTAEAPPRWAERTLGPVPDEPLQRLDWEHRAGAVASYREMFGYSDPDQPIGEEPVNSPEARQHWHAAFAALGPADGIDLRQASDGRLLNMRNSYQAETAWAPQWVGDELRQVRIAADAAARDAALADAQAQAARQQEQHDLAQLHETVARSNRANEATYRRFEVMFADTMKAREEWERTTEQTRHNALAAHTEYLRRHPDAELPPMRSAEPDRPTEEERAQLTPRAGQAELPEPVHADNEPNPVREDSQPQPDDQVGDLDVSQQAEAEPELQGPVQADDPEPEPRDDEHQGDEHQDTPAWVSDMTERNRAARARIEELQNLRTPSEDHEQEDEGEAWPAPAPLYRDAVLQPPPPEIRPAPEVERAHEMASAEREAGE